MKKLKHIIGGNKVSGNSKTVFNIYNPATGEITATMRGSSKTDVDLAVKSANNAFKNWQKVPPSKRAHIMFTYRNLLYEHLDELAILVSKEHGKTLTDAKGEIVRGIEVVEFCTSINNHLKSDFLTDVSENIDSYNIRQPLGVCAGIVPFNFPVMVPMWMFPVAISCGNTFLLKLSEKNPSAGLRITELLTEAGLPTGVLNTIVGNKESVDAMLEHPDIMAISFVGSTKVGEYVYKQGCNYNKRVQSLCGAKNHMVVMPDASLDKTCNAILGAAYGSAGERCMAISVVVTVGNNIANKLVSKLSPMINNLKIGRYDEPDVEMGPIISQQNKTKILSYVEKGINEGAELKVDGSKKSKQNGFFVGGFLFDKVNPNMSIYKDEIFGPVLSIVRVDTYKEALELVNKHEYGNGSAIFTCDGDTARDFSCNVKTGMVGVNVPIPVPVANHSFGGWKRSLFGANAIHGMEGIRFYTKLKTITSRWYSSIKNGAQFNFASGKDTK